MNPTPVASVELLSAAAFKEELRRIARYRAYPAVGDPLDSAVKRIERNPAFAQSRLLARLITAVAYDRGEFRRAELAAFDSETLALAINLMDTHAAGTATTDDWARGVDAAAAALGGDG